MIKLIGCGDFHLTNKRPDKRVDDYAGAVLRKLNFILETAIEEKASAIIQAADFFDMPKPAYSFYIEIYKLIENANIMVITTFGQHDMLMRNYENTALNAFFKTAPFMICADQMPGTLQDNIHIYGSPYNTKIPEVNNKDDFNILIAHRMVIKTKLWEGQEGAEYGSDLLRKYPGYNLMITGDNHQNFICEERDRILLNPGSLMRSSSSQIGHQPKLYVISIDEKKGIIVDIDEVDIPIEPADKVFCLEEIAKNKEVDENLTAYIEGLKDFKPQDLQLEDNLNSYLKENNIEQGIIDILEESKEDKKDGSKIA